MNLKKTAILVIVFCMVCLLLSACHAKDTEIVAPFSTLKPKAAGSKTALDGLETPPAQQAELSDGMAPSDGASEQMGGSEATPTAVATISLPSNEFTALLPAVPVVINGVNESETAVTASMEAMTVEAFSAYCASLRANGFIANEVNSASGAVSYFAAQNSANVSVILSVYEHMSLLSIDWTNKA